ncbi:MAG: DotH/IcmK family type IV secretion protein [Legionellaceae bacterium]|nr:DotH/IcmK family type IV secretion protein [Legionellaceae bacterium]
MTLKKVKLFSLSVLLNMGVMLPLSTVHAADDPGSAKQALEQLRMLQKRLSSDSSKKTSPSNIKESDAHVTQKDEKAKAVEKSKEAAEERRDRLAAQSRASSEQNLTPGELDIVDESDNNKIVDTMAFKGIERQLFPLDPDKIKTLRQLYNKTEFAKTLPADTPPKPMATSQFINLSPGSTPPVIRLSQGFVSSLVFLDSTGAPWPISAYDLGDPASFNIQWDKTSNTLMIQSTKLYTYGNLAVRLRGLNTPVMLTLIPGQKAVDYRVDLRVQGYGPNAKSMPMEEGLPPSASDVLLHVLDGVPPAGSTRLTISGGDARAWLLENKMFVRTNLTILSPGWIGSMTSADGMHAYEMQKSPVLLVSWHGKVMQLKVEGL